MRTAPMTLRVRGESDLIGFVRSSTSYPNFRKYGASGRLFLVFARNISKWPSLESVRSTCQYLSSVVLRLLRHSCMILAGTAYAASLFLIDPAGLTGRPQT